MRKVKRINSNSLLKWIAIVCVNIVSIRAAHRTSDLELLRVAIERVQYQFPRDAVFDVLAAFHYECHFVAAEVIREECDDFFRNKYGFCRVDETLHAVCAR